MAITLAEAKATLSVYVDNGVYQDDSRVIARINEAQRRLYAVRSWLGVLAKYVVQVNAGLFVLPDYTGSISQATGFGGFGLNTILRVTSSSIPSSWGSEHVLDQYRAGFLGRWTIHREGQP